MKKRLELESKKIKHSFSQGRSLGITPISSSHKLYLEKYSNFLWNSPSHKNLVSSNELSESFDTCIFPSTETNSTFVTKKKQKDFGCQTESENQSFEQLKKENIQLFSEVRTLRYEIEELREAVKDLQTHKNLAKIKSNEELISYLEKENSLIKKNFDL